MIASKNENSRIGHCSCRVLNFERWYLKGERPRETSWRPQRPVPAHRFWPGSANLVSNAAPKATLVWGKYTFVGKTKHNFSGNNMTTWIFEKVDCWDIEHRFLIPATMTSMKNIRIKFGGISFFFRWYFPGIYTSMNFDISAAPCLQGRGVWDAYCWLLVTPMASTRPRLCRQPWWGGMLLCAYISFFFCFSSFFQTQDSSTARPRKTSQQLEHPTKVHLGIILGPFSLFTFDASLRNTETSHFATNIKRIDLHCVSRLRMLVSKSLPESCFFKMPSRTTLFFILCCSSSKK